MSTAVLPRRQAVRWEPDPAMAGSAGDWTVELDRLELDVIRAERALSAGVPMRTDAWTPRNDLGNMPTSMIERATDLLDRQQACLEQLAHQLGRNVQHQAVCSTISRATARQQVPVYVDLPI